MIIYLLLHVSIIVICIVGLFRSWRVLKRYPESIGFAKWPLSLLIVLLTCSALTVIDLFIADFISNQGLNIIAAVQLIYSAVVAAVCIPYLARVGDAG